MKKIVIFRNFIFPTLPAITASISSNLVPLPWKSIELFFFRLRQLKKIENGISLSKIGLEIKFWAILSEIVYIYSIYIVFCLNYIFLFYSLFWPEKPLGVGPP